MFVLKVENLNKSFGGVHAVRHCSFALDEKKITALIGPNGAGKTTLFNVVNGFIPADEGEVVFRGERVTHLDVWQRSRLGMSRTFQLSRLFRNLTIAENLVLAVREDDDLFWRVFWKRSGYETFEEKIQEMMEFVGLKKDFHANVANLSYGEQKLFDLARALLNPHKFLLLDEPVAGVNPVIREKLKLIMRQLNEKGESVLLIEHDIDFVRSVADRVIVMDQGAVLKQGEPEEVLRDKEVLAAYLGSNH